MPTNIKLKLSDVKEKLRQCAEQGVEIRIFEKEKMNYYPWPFGIDVFQPPTTIHNIHAPMTYAFKSLDDPIHIDVQAQIIAALEQFAEARGYKPCYDWVEVGHGIEDIVEFIPTNSTMRKKSRPNPKQGEGKFVTTLEAFLAIDWGGEGDR